MIRVRPQTVVLASLATAAIVATAAGRLTQPEPDPRPNAAGSRAQPARTAARPALLALTTASAIASARRYARSRAGTVAFAAIDGSGRVRGLRRTVGFPSASVVKAMLLVAALRAAGDGPLPDTQRGLLEPMIARSENKAAYAIYNQVGATGLFRVARAAGMRRFALPALFDARIDPADQARFFRTIDRRVPPRHRAYTRRLLSSIVSWQRWGIPPASRERRRVRTFLKGGWRAGLVHQVALLQRGEQRLGLAILTSGQPSQAYGQQSVEGVARRVLRVG
jgi:hypothetical protein